MKEAFKDKIKYRYRVIAGPHKGLTATILGPIVALEDAEGGADLYFPVEFQENPGLPAFIMKMDIEDRMTPEDFSQIFNEYEGEEADKNRLKWLVGNQDSLRLTVHINQECTYVSNCDFFSNTAEKKKEVVFDFSENLVSVAGVKSLLDALGIKNEIDTHESCETPPEAPKEAPEAK